MQITHKKLKNGLKVYVAPMKGTATATVLVLFGVGSKYENKRTNGLSHFLEHMFFKGTTKRPTPQEVVEVIDKVGGEFNAFTGKEYTGYYAKVDKTHLETAVDWVSDMLLNPIMDKTEIEREKIVIHQEISMIKDTPMRNIYDVFEENLYGDQPAGWDIAGSPQTVSNCTRKDLLNYFHKHYTSAQSTVIIAGNVNEKKAEDLIEKYFANFKRGKKSTKPAVKESQKSPTLFVKLKDTDQSHLMLGVRAFDAFDKRRTALSVMATILGGYMSSRLFMELRERHGLAYYVTCEAEHYTDSGYLAVRAGVPNKDVVKAVGIIMSELRKVKDEGVTEDELKKAKEYIKGKSLMGLESSSAMANFIGDRVLMYGKPVTVEELFAKLEKVTAIQIQELANELFVNKTLNLTIIGPKGKEKELRKVLKF
jgi:predicted Zn-dependent peptidase